MKYHTVPIRLALRAKLHSITWWGSGHRGALVQGGRLAHPMNVAVQGQINSRGTLLTPKSCPHTRIQKKTSTKMFIAVLFVEAFEGTW